MLTDRERTFFASFSDFQPAIKSSSIAEFCRLAELKGWSQGSDVYASFWRACFGIDCPGSAAHPLVDDDRDAAKAPISNQRVISTAAQPRSSEKASNEVVSLEKALHGLALQTPTTGSAEASLSVLTPASSIAGDGVLIKYFDTFPGFTPNNTAPLREEFDRLADLQKWSKNSEAYRRQLARCCKDELAVFYGNDSLLEAWQAIYMDLTGNSPPPTKTQCRKMLESYYVNIFDIIDCKRANIPVTPVFTTRSSFRRYTKKQKSVFPIAAAKQHPVVSILMENIFGGRQL